MKRTPWKRKPYVWKRSDKPMNKVGRKGRANAKADRETKAKAERDGIDYCQLCGRNISLSRSHDYKKRFNKDLDVVTILCIDPCHKFIEERLDSETRTAVNAFIRNTTFEGEYKFAKIVEMIPEHLREEFIFKITRQL